MGHEKGLIPVSNGLSDEIAKELKAYGFKYLGTVTVYSHLQACGIINDHGKDCPGWINTTGTEITGPDALQQPTGRVGKPEDIAEMALFLCSDRAGFITGENICIDGGMTKLMVYHGEHGWTFQS